MYDRIEFVRNCVACGLPTEEEERAVLATETRNDRTIMVEMHGPCLVELLNRHAAGRFTLEDLVLR